MARALSSGFLLVSNIHSFDIKRIFPFFLSLMAKLCLSSMPQVSPVTLLQLHGQLVTTMHVCYAQCTLLPFAQHWIRTFDLSLVFKAYHLRREETDWFDKPRESRLENGHGLDRRLPEKLSHSRPPSQHQDQVSCQVSSVSSCINV